jgi:hypothetical protein
LASTMSRDVVRPDLLPKVAAYRAVSLELLSCFPPVSGIQKAISAAGHKVSGGHGQRAADAVCLGLWDADSSWVRPPLRQDGRKPMTCVLGSEPYELLKTFLPRLTKPIFVSWAVAEPLGHGNRFWVRVHELDAVKTQGICILPPTTSGRSLSAFPGRPISRPLVRPLSLVVFKNPADLSRPSSPQ